MRYVYFISNAVLGWLVGMAFLGSAVACAQQVSSSAMPAVTEYVSTGTSMGGTFEVHALIPLANPIIPSEVDPMANSNPDIDRMAHSLTLEWDRNRANSWIAYSFAAPTRQHATGMSSNIGTQYWTNTLANGNTLNLNKSKTATASLSTYWETRTPDQEFKGALGTPGQSLTLEWGVTQLIPLDKHETRFLEFGVAGYDEWLTANSGVVLPSSVSVRGMPMSVHATGFQANFTVPRKDLSFTFKYEPQYKVHNLLPGRMIVFGASWTW